MSLAWAGFLFGASVAQGGCGREPQAAARSRRDGAATPRIALSAPGRIEAATEVIELGAATDGVLAEVLVTEGQVVARGEVLARLACDDRRAQVELMRHNLAAAGQARARLVRGSRLEERRAAAAAALAAQAVLDQAEQRHERLSRLDQAGAVSREELDLARRDLEVARAQHEAALERQRLVEAPPLPEERAKADAEVGAAAAALREAEAGLEKCVIVAPIPGTVLRRHLDAGESISVTFPRPIVSLADLARLRVRAELDERDVGRVAVGQPVLITADALGADRPRGRVTRLGALMGRKRVRTGDPAEKSDRDVQEILIDLEGTDPRLVTGLRVTVLFLE